MKAENATNDFVLSHIKVFFYNLFLKFVEVMVYLNRDNFKRLLN